MNDQPTGRSATAKARLNREAKAKARVDLLASQRADLIQRALADAPLMRPEQRDRVARLLAQMGGGAA